MFMIIKKQFTTICRVNLQSGYNDNDGINDDNENDNDYVGKALLSAELCQDLLHKVKKQSD